MGALFEILYEDENLLVLNKPAGLVCHPTKGDAYSSLIGRVRLHVRDQHSPHLINRLDRETSGVVVVAKNIGSAVRLRRIWERRDVHKEYWAIVRGSVSESHGVIDAPLGKDVHSRVAIKDCVREDGAKARTEFWLERSFSRAGQEFSLLRVMPLTGRKHQIRIHLAHYGHPIVGDKLYGGNEEFYLALVEGRLTARDRSELILPNHALHAREVRFVWDERLLVFCAAPEHWFSNFLNFSEP